MTLEAVMATSAGLIALAALIEAAVGYPKPLYAVIAHPVVWIGALIAGLDRRFNPPVWHAGVRRLTGIATLLIVAGCAAGVAALISWALPGSWPWRVVEAALASTLLAQRSLYDHVAAVSTPLSNGDLDGARQALSMIVGRDVSVLDEGGVSRAAIESLSENMSDGVVAPALWGAALGLPGIAAYKAINTLDSMIGHRTPRHGAFGWASARMDDLVNLIPARFTALLLAIAAGSKFGPAARCAWRDARHHRSPNGGWPEAAMAGAVGIRLSGPRIYADHVANEPWLNADAPDPGAAGIARALRLYRRGCVLLIALLAGFAIMQALL